MTLLCTNTLGIYTLKTKKDDAKEAWLKSLEIDPKNDKLKTKYKEAGFGDPDKEERIKVKVKELEEKERKKKKDDLEGKGVGANGLLSTYQVKEGDTLESIAGRGEVYGDSSKWRLLYEGNRSQIRDPKILHPGQILQIPRGETAQEKKE